MGNGKGRWVGYLNPATTAVTTRHKARPTDVKVHYEREADEAEKDVENQTKDNCDDRPGQARVAKKRNVDADQHHPHHQPRHNQN